MRPEPFLNYILFDKDMSYVTAGFQQISTSAQGIGVHETISINDIKPGQDGYILMYLSNENQEAVNIHWDDFTVYHGKTNVVSTQDYYPFGLTFNESVRVASTEQNFLFNGIERVDDFGLNWDLAEYRSYDPSIARWHQIDPKASERESPYVGFGNNPIFYADPLGDTVNLANIVINDRANGTNLAGKIVDGLSAVTGLTLSIDDNGFLNYAKDEDGNPIKIGNGGESADESPVGSETAANDLIDLINGGKVDVRKGNDRTVAKGNEIFVSESQIDGFINQTPDVLNSETMGYGMTMMHEFTHTNVGGGLSDPTNKSDVTSTGATVDRVNQYRSELDSNGTVGKPFGTRQHYNAVPVGNGGYVTFQYRNLKRKVRSTRIKVK